MLCECKSVLEKSDNQNNTDAITCLLILSRNSDYQKRLAEDDIISLLVREAGIQPGAPKRSDENIIAALKCLSNIIFKTPHAINIVR